jgi:serine/threonine protein kinase
MKEWLSSLFRGRDAAGKSNNEASPDGRTPESNRPSEGWRLGQTVLDDFMVERLLGEGGMGKVYLLQSQSTGDALRREAGQRIERG